MKIKNKERKKLERRSNKEKRINLKMERNKKLIQTAMSKLLKTLIEK
jgi:hypothetical protein